MMSEWFHIRQWEANRKKVWCLFDNEGNMILSDVDKYTAISKQEELKSQRVVTQIVNKHEARYYKIINNNNKDSK
jgi:hypothetical protein